jgi:hypothetical protein
MLKSHARSTVRKRTRLYLEWTRTGNCRSVPLEILDFALMTFGGVTRTKRAEVAAMTGLIGFPRVKAVFSGFKSANHTSLQIPLWRASGMPEWKTRSF